MYDFLYEISESVPGLPVRLGGQAGSSRRRAARWGPCPETVRTPPPQENEHGTMAEYIRARREKRRPLPRRRRRRVKFAASLTSGIATAALAALTAGSAFADETRINFAYGTSDQEIAIPGIDGFPVLEFSFGGSGCERERLPAPRRGRCGRLISTACLSTGTAQSARFRHGLEYTTRTIRHCRQPPAASPIRKSKWTRLHPFFG